MSFPWRTADIRKRFLSDALVDAVTDGGKSVCPTLVINAPDEALTRKLRAFCPSRTSSVRSPPGSLSNRWTAATPDAPSAAGSPAS